MREVFEIESLINRLPYDIINHIIPYTYNLQSKSLLEDIKNYKKVKISLLEIYKYIWIEWVGSNSQDDDKYWLINDLIAYSNDYKATMFGYVDKFYEIWKRNNFLKTRQEIDVYFKKIERKNVSTQINIVLGLLTPTERNEILDWIELVKTAWPLLLEDNDL
jgi:hypothetical protein